MLLPVQPAQQPRQPDGHARGPQPQLAPRSGERVLRRLVVDAEQVGDLARAASVAGVRERTALQDAEGVDAGGEPAGLAPVGDDLLG